MTMIVDRTEHRDERSGSRERDSSPEPVRRRIDVTDLHAAGIEEFIDSNVDAKAVSLEHRGARTFLVLEG